MAVGSVKDNKDDFIFINTVGSDRFNLSQLDSIRCPDCSKDNLVKTELGDKWVCPACGLCLPESQLSEAVTVIPDTSQGMSITTKPYFQQQAQNKKTRASDGRPNSIMTAMSFQEDDNAKILNKYSLSGLAQIERDKTDGVTIKQQGNRVNYSSPKAVDVKNVVRKLFPLNATDIKIDLV